METNSTPPRAHQWLVSNAGGPGLPILGILTWGGPVGYETALALAITRYHPHVRVHPMSTVDVGATEGRDREAGRIS